MKNQKGIIADPKNRARKSIIWLVILFASFFVAMVAIGVWYYLAQEYQIKTQKQNELSAVAELKVQDIVDWRNERFNDGLNITGNPLISQSVQAYLLDPQNAELKQQNISWLANIRSTYSYSTFFLLDTNGEILIRDNTHPESIGSEEVSFTKQAAQSQRVMLSDLHFTSAGTAIRMDLIIPLLDSSQHTIAVVVLPIDPYLYLYPLIRAWPIPSQSAETLLIEKQGSNGVYLNPLKFGANSALSRHFMLNSPDLPAAKELRGETSPFEGKDYRGVAVVAVGAPVPNTDWHMISKVDNSEIYADVRRQSQTVAIVLGLTLILDLLTAYYVIRRQRLKLLNEILKRELEQQKLKQRYDLLFENSNDIVMVVDEMGKISAVNDRAIQTYGYSREELLQANVNSLRLETNQNKFKKKMAEAKQKGGVRFDLVEKRRDGTTFPVEVSARYFELDQKGFFLDIVRDISERKIYENKIVVSEARYRSLIEHTSDAIFLADSTGRFLDVNEQGCRMAGYLLDEILKLTVDDLVEPEDLRVKPLRIRKLASHTDNVLISERNLIRKDGSRFPAEIIAYGLPEGHMQGVVRDITERVKHRKELEDAAEKYRQLFNSNPVPLYVYDLETLNFLAVNDAALRYYEYSREEFLKMRLPAIQSEQTIPDQKEGIQLPGEYISCPWKHIKKSGEKIDVEITSHSLSFNERLSRLEIAVDVTEKLHIENELKENLGALKSLIDTSPLGIVTTDMDGNITLWSKQAEAIFGWKEEELLGKPYPLIPESSAENVQAIIEKNVSQDEGRHYEAERKRKNGSLITIEIDVAPIHDYRNQVKGMLALFSDVTEIKAIELANQKISEERNQLFNRLNLQFNRMPIGFILTDENLTVLDWNPSAERIFGYSREEMIGKSEYDTIIPANAAQVVKSIIDKVGKENRTEISTNENLTKDGRLIMVEWHNTSLLDESGNFVALMDMAIDVTEKVTAERKLRESEEKLRTVFDSNLVGIDFADISGKILSANDELLHILGYNREELEAGLIRWDKITPEEFLPLDEAAIKQAQENGVCTPYEKQYIRKNGTRVWVLIGFAMIGESGELTSGFVLDISERKQTEQSLIESEANYRGLFTHMLNGMAFCKMLYENGKPVDFIYLKTNEAFEKITGLKNVENKNVSELIPGIQKENPEIFEIYGRVAKSGIPDKFETYVPGLDVTFSVFVYSPKPEYFVALFEDVSEQRRIEKEIQRKQELLNMTGRVGKIGGWEIDVVKGTSTWNEEVARIHDLDPEVQPSVEFGLNFYSPESRPLIEHALKEAIEHAKPYDLELEIMSAKGVHKLIRTAGQPEVVDGKVIWVRGIMQDITELKRAEAEIRKLNDELEERVRDRTAELIEANQELESFSYSVSHDLRAPIRAIDGFAQIIVDDFSKDVNPEILRYIDIIRLNTKNMGNLVDDLLAFSRLGRQSLQKQTVNTQKLVEEIIDEVKFGLKNRKIEFKIGNLPDCEADLNLLRQVFINLISNAVKFTRECKVAQVEIGSTALTPPGANDLAKYTKYCYYVKDNGVGFDMRYYDKLFGVFQRLHKSEDYEGTGVGLAIVKRVIEKHEGSVWAESKLNVGTTFYFVLGEKDKK